MTENPLDSVTEPPSLTMEFRLMPCLGPAIGAIVLMAGMAVGIAAAPKEDSVLATAVVLVTATCLGAGLAYFLRLRCRIEVPWPYRTLRWSIRKEHQQVVLDHIVRVTTLLDETSDEHAYHVAFELKNGHCVRLSGYSWGKRHAEKLARQLRHFLEGVARATADRATRAE